VRIAALAAAICCALMLMAPSGASAFSKAIWGPITRDGVAQFPLYHELGASIYEDDLDWYTIAPKKPANPTNPNDPAYQWPVAVQQSIAEAARYHMRVTLQIIGAPSWANGGHSGFGWAPTNPKTFAQFAEAAARKYPSVHLWMIWGEPTKAGNFQPDVSASPGSQLYAAQTAAPHLYAQILNDSYGTLKSVSKKNLVIGGNTFTTGEISTQQWLDNLKLPNGKPPRLDMWGHNPFSYSAPSFTDAPSPFGEVQFSDLPYLEKWLRRVYHRTIPLFLSEFEIPTQPDDTFNFYVNATIAGQWVTKALQLARKTSWIYALGWINLYDSLPLEAGGLLTQNGVPKPDFYSFKNG
jgi:hypothetical protein